MSELPAYENLGNGIYCIDTGYGRPGLAACYLITSGPGAAFIDTGTANSVPSLLALLDHLGIARDHVEYVIPTHVHLDHAGGSGQLMASCPNASLIVHPKGAPHMIDPARLTAGATAVYGEEAFRRDFGMLEPVPEHRVRMAEDGDSFSLNGRTLGFLDTPGHANHHGCIWDARSKGLFTGDTCGIAYPELGTADGPWLFAPTTPVAFDPDAWHRSVDRLMSLSPERLFLTHFGVIDVTPAISDRLHDSIDSLAATALGEAERTENRVQVLRDRVRGLLVDEAREHGVTLGEDRIVELLAMDIDLNAQGLDVWLTRRAKRRED